MQVSQVAIVDNMSNATSNDEERQGIKRKVEVTIVISSKNCVNKGSLQKKVWNFPYFPKPTHPTRLVWKKIKITWSKNHFYAKISILAKNIFSH